MEKIRKQFRRLSVLRKRLVRSKSADTFTCACGKSQLAYSRSAGEAQGAGEARGKHSELSVVRRQTWQGFCLDTVFGAHVLRPRGSDMSFKSCIIIFLLTSLQILTCTTYWV